MKLLAIPASNSRTSINRTLVHLAAERLRNEFVPDMTIEVIDLNDYEMPIYSTDREREGGIPEAARRLFEKIGAADALLISFAEHNGTVSAAWKNIYDWMSRIDARVWQNKPMVLMAATPGPRAGAGVLASQQAVAPFFGGEIKASIGIGEWHQAFDTTSAVLTRSQDIAALDDALATLAPDLTVPLTEAVAGYG